MTNLPVPPTPFIGREREASAVAALLRQDDVGLVTLTGPGGAGKTRLALQVAADLQASFEHGAFFVDLAPVTDPGLIAPSIAGVLGVREVGGAALAELLKQYLRSRELLLVLDNLEQLLSGSDVGLFSDILEAAPAVKLLVTSREVLNLREEWLYPLDGLDFPDERDVGPAVTSYGAIQLFETCARRVQPRFSLGEEREAVIRICRLVRGMPLAIELAASWIKMLGCAEIAEEIEGNINFLVSSLRDVPERHRSMQAIFDQSWKLLDEPEQEALKRLSVFRGGFGRRAAEKVAGASLVTLSGLVDKSILRRREDGRYQLHELLRQYAEEQLSPEALDQTRSLHCDVYASFLEARLPDMLGGRQLEALTEIGAELENVRAAWRWGIKRKNSDALYRSAESLALFYIFLNRYYEGCQAFEQAEQSLQDAGTHRQVELARVRIWFNLAWFYIRLGRLEEAEEMGNRCREAYGRLEIPLVPGQGTDPSLILGIVALVRGDYPRASRLGEEVKQRSALEDHLWNRQFGYYVLAQAALGQGEYETAQHYAQEAYDTTEQSGDRWFRAYCLNDMGDVALAQGDYAGAKDYYEASYGLREEFNDPEGMAVALNHLGDVSASQERYGEAQERYQRSREIYEEIGDKGGLATSLKGLANAAVAQDDVGTAAELYREALKLATEIHYRPLILDLLIGISKLLHQTGQRERCAELLTLVIHHPAGEEVTKSRARKALELCQAVLSREQFAISMQRGREIALETVVASLMAELIKPVKVSRVESGPLIPGSARSANELLADPLTPRELEVLKLMADGLTNRSIADELIISVGTVKSYTSQIYSKLGASNRTQAVALARELKLLRS